MRANNLKQWFADLLIIILLVLLVLGQRDAAKERKRQQAEILTLRQRIEQDALDAADRAGRQSAYRTEARAEHARLQGEINRLKHYMRYEHETTSEEP